jgi:hypothetical protein
MQYNAYYLKTKAWSNIAAVLIWLRVYHSCDDDYIARYTATVHTHLSDVQIGLYKYI